MGKRILSLTLVLIFCLSLVSCGDKIEVVTEIKYSVFDNDGTDMIGFYTTSITDDDGVWSYSTAGDEIFEIFYESVETPEYGNFFNKKQARYETLMLKPISEGNATFTFTLSERGDVRMYDVTAKKDEHGILRIKAEETDPIEEQQEQ